MNTSSMNIEECLKDLIENDLARNEISYEIDTIGKLYARKITDKSLNGSFNRVLMKNNKRTDISKFPINSVLCDSLFENYYDSIGYEEKPNKYIEFFQTFSGDSIISANRMFFNAHILEYHGSSYENMIFCESMFENCCKMTYCKISFGSSIKSFRKAFKNCPLKTLENISIKDASKCQSFQSSFENTEITNLKGLEKWTVNKSIDFSNMFSKCKFLTDCSAIDSWELSENDTVKNMFNECPNIIRYPVWFVV